MTDPAETAETPVPRRGVKPAGPLSAYGLSLMAAVLVVDQATKFAAERYLPFAQPVDLLPILSLYRTYNTGVAFSLFRDAGSLMLLAAIVLVCGLVFWIWSRAEEGGRLAATAYALIGGGAIGNLIDRAVYGHVVDFLLLHFGTWSLFVFNIADAALTVGPALLIAFFLFGSRPKT